MQQQQALLKLRQQQALQSRRRSILSSLRSEPFLAVLDSALISLKDNSQLLSTSQAFQGKLIDIYSSNQLLQKFFQRELEDLKSRLQELPDQKATLYEFIAICIEVLKITSQGGVFALNGLRQLFSKVVRGKQEKVLTYQDFLKFNLNSQPSPPNQQAQTKFMLRFFQSKQQSTVFHQNLIQKIIYSKALRLLLVLDLDQTHLKLLDSSMKLLHRVGASKGVSKSLRINSFGWSQITQKVCLAMEDGALVLINLKQYLIDPTNTQTQLIYQLGQPLLDVHFLDLSNFWLGITQAKSYLRIWTEKKHAQEFQIPGLSGFSLSGLSQVAQKNEVILTQGSHLMVMDQNLTKLKFDFVHTSQIKEFRYSKANNAYYVVGRERHLTIFTHESRTHQFNVKTHQLSKFYLQAFQLIEYAGILVIFDSDSCLRLIDTHDWKETQSLSLKHLKKAKGDPRLLQITKNNFILAKQQILNYQISKKAIEIDFNLKFVARIQIEGKELSLGINNQLVSVELQSCLPNNTYSKENSNNDIGIRGFVKLNSKFIVLDQDNSLKQIFMFDQATQGTQKFNKKVISKEVTHISYDQPNSLILLAGPFALFVLHYQGNNNFNLLRSLYLCATPAYAMKLCFFGQNSLSAANEQGMIVTDTSSLQSRLLLTDSKLIWIEQVNQRLFFLITQQNNLYMYDSQRKTTTFMKCDLRLIKAIRLSITIQRFKAVTQVFSEDQTDPVRQTKQYLALTDTHGQLIVIDITRTLKSFPSSSARISPYNSSFKTIFQGDLKTETLALQKAVPQEFKSWDIGPKNKAKCHYQEIIDIKGIYLEQQIFVTLSKDLSFKLLNTSLATIVEVQLPTFTKSVNLIQQLLSKRGQTNLKRTALMLEKIRQFREGERLNRKEIEELLKENNYSAISGVVQDIMFSVSEIENKYGSAVQDLRQSMVGSQKVLSPKVHRPNKLEKRFDNLCQLVNSKHKSCHVPPQIEQERKKIHKHDSYENSKRQTKLSIYRIKKLTGFKQNIAERFRQQVGYDLEAEQLLQLRMPQPKPPSQEGTTLDAGQKLQIDKQNKAKFSRIRKVFLQDERDKRNKPTSIPKRDFVIRTNRKSQAPSISYSQQPVRRDQDMDVRRLLSDIQRIFDEQRRRKQLQKKEAARRQQERAIRDYL